MGQQQDLIKIALISHCDGNEDYDSEDDEDEEDEEGDKEEEDEGAADGGRGGNITLTTALTGNPL